MAGLYISAAGIANALRRSAITAANLANLRTPGYRAARAHSTETAGGGVTVSEVSRDNAQGPIEFTGRPTDVATSAGFFRVTLSDGSTGYTRDGHFGLNANGEVVTAAGARLDPPIQVPPGSTRVTVSRDGTVTALVPGEDGPQVVGRIEVFQFPNPDGLESAGGNVYRQTAASGEAIPVTDSVAYYPGALQGSNVSVVREQANAILDTRAAQANINAFRAQADVLGELLDMRG